MFSYLIRLWSLLSGPSLLSLFDNCKNFDFTHRSIFRAKEFLRFCRFYDRKKSHFGWKRFDALPSRSLYTNRYFESCSVKDRKQTINANPHHWQQWLSTILQFQTWTPTEARTRRSVSACIAHGQPSPATEETSDGQRLSLRKRAHDWWVSMTFKIVSRWLLSARRFPRRIFICSFNCAREIKFQIYRHLSSLLNQRLVRQSATV